MLAFFLPGTYALLLKIKELPKKGDKIIINSQNLEAYATGWTGDPPLGSVLTVGKRWNKNLGFRNRDKTYPTYGGKLH